MPASLRLEIDFTQNVVLPARAMPYQNVYGVDVTVSVMDIKEMCAEKIRAMNERYRYRDFYDFGMIMKMFGLDLLEIVDLLQQKELRKPLLVDNILEHWQLAREAKNIDAAQIFTTEEIDDETVEEFLNLISVK